MKIIPTNISDVKLIVPRIFEDSRGVFSETYKNASLKEYGIDLQFIQDNRSHSRKLYTLRGLHYQIAPFAQAKLVSVQRGRIYDVAVDLRRSSPTYGQHVSAELTAEGGEQLLIPAGFAHGFCTLEPETTVTYKVDHPYSPAHERGLYWRTSAFDIAWPCPADQVLLSPKDELLPQNVEPDDCFP